MNESNMFSKEVSKFIEEEMWIDIRDLSHKITTVMPDNRSIFNDLFEFMIYLELASEYDSKKLSSLVNRENDKLINKKFNIFLHKHSFPEGSLEYFIIDNIRHAFLNFRMGGVLQMYQHRETEGWYPKVIVNKFLGVQKDIDKLEDEIIIYRGTSEEEFKSKKFGQSWSLDENIAYAFAFEHYKNHSEYQNTTRVVMKAIIKKENIFYYKYAGREDEVIINAVRAIKYNKGNIHVRKQRIQL